MDSKTVKNLLYAVIIVLLLCVAGVGGVYIATSMQAPSEQKVDQRAEATENEEKRDLLEAEKTYQKAISDLEDKDYEEAYKSLSSLKEKNIVSDKMKNIQELYCYTRAKLYLKEGNKLSSEEILAKIRDDYDGDFSKEIKEMKVSFLKDTTPAKKEIVNDNAVKVLESQQLLISKKENIRVKANNQIATIRDKQSREDIAYKEGFLGLQTYFTNKAQNDIDIQKIRLNAANEEIEAIKNSLFNTQEEKQIELDTAISKKNRVEQELQYAYTAQREVAANTEAFDRAMQQLR